MSSVPAVRATQRGFTLIEMMVVLTIIGIVSGYFGSSVYGNSNDAKMAIAFETLTQEIPKALQSAKMADAGMGLGLGELKGPLVDRGVESETPWGTSWSVESATNATMTNEIQVDYVAGRAGTNRDENAKRLANRIRSTDGLPMIINDRVSGRNGRVTVYYTVP